MDTKNIKNLWVPDPKQLIWSIKIDQVQLRKCLRKNPEQSLLGSAPETILMFRDGPNEIYLWPLRKWIDYHTVFYIYFESGKPEARITYDKEQNIFKVDTELYEGKIKAPKVNIKFMHLFR